jgi:hypothetical protein
VALDRCADTGELLVNTTGATDIFGHSCLEKAAVMATQCLGAHDAGPTIARRDKVAA